MKKAKSGRFNKAPNAYNTTKPSPKLMALAILICGADVMGLWYLGTLLVPATAPLAISGYLPVAVAVAGAALAAAANLLRIPRE